MITLGVTAAPQATEAERLRDQALNDPVAWQTLAALTTEIGARPVGSPAMARAKDWAVARLKMLGFSNVHTEAFIKENAWVRGMESARVVSDDPRALAVTALGNAAPTPPDGLEAEIAVFPTVWELIAAPRGSLTGKIAVVNQPMVRTQNEEGYRNAVRARTEGPALAAERGAIGYLTRSITASPAPLPHTGLARFSAGASRIPAAALSAPDADHLARLAARGRPIRIRLVLQSTVIPSVPAWNVVGEIKGREHPEQIVLIGGHLDSWDLSESASDDGAGVAITVATAALIGRAPNHPRRTIRVVLWGSEETEGSGAAYAAAHAGEAAQIALAAESDFGAGRAYRLALPRMDAAEPFFDRLAAALAPIGVLLSAEPARSGGSDVEPLRASGVPIASLNQDQTRYFDAHHSAADTLSQIDRAELNQCVAAWTALVFSVADSDIDFRTPPATGGHP